MPQEDNLTRYDGGTEPKEKMGKNAAVGFYRKINLEALQKYFYLRLICQKIKQLWSINH